MGVINVTPDSFSDGGALYRGKRPDLQLSLQRARTLVAEGACILDVGGESTRPGATPVSEQEEMERVLPLVEAIAAELDVTISVDTSSPVLMRESASRGAGMLNDVRALTRSDALEAAVSSGLPVCLMHMQGSPGTMQEEPAYKDVVQEVKSWLGERARVCIEAGIEPANILLDPGFGFGKTVRHNLQLLDELPQLALLGYPLLVGLSRKSMIGTLLGREVDHRLPASLALAVLAAERGAGIIRTHDVQATADAVAMVSALADAAREEEK